MKKEKRVTWLPAVKNYLIGAAMGAGVPAAFYIFHNITDLIIINDDIVHMLLFYFGIIAVPILIVIERIKRMSGCIYNIAFIIFMFWFFYIGIFFVDLLDGLIREAIGAYRVWSPGLDEKGYGTISALFFSVICLIIKLIAGFVFFIIDISKSNGEVEK